MVCSIVERENMVVYQKEVDGEWYSRFQINGERKHLKCHGAKTQQQAELAEIEFKNILRQQQNGIMPRKEKTFPKLKKVTDSFLRYSELNRKTYKQDKARIKVILDFWDSKKDASKITFDDINDLKSFLLSSGRKKKTVNLYLGILREAYNIAIDNDLLIKNPFKAKKVYFKLNPKKLSYLKPDERKILEKHLPEYFYPIVITALNTGLRRDNIINLTWDELDFNFKTIEITKNKGKKYIKLPMNDTLYNLFKNMKKESEYVFSNPRTGRKWGTTAFNKEWIKIRNKAGLHDFKFHGLRHTVATYLIKAGVTAVVVKEILAHSDISTTMRYIHIDSMDMSNAMSILNSFN